MRAIGTRQQIALHVYFNLFHGFGAPQMSQRTGIGQHALEMRPSHEKNKGLKDTDMKKRNAITLFGHEPRQDDFEDGDVIDKLNDKMSKNGTDQTTGVTEHEPKLATGRGFWFGYVALDVVQTTKGFGCKFLVFVWVGGGTATSAYLLALAIVPVAVAVVAHVAWGFVGIGCVAN